MASRLYIRRGTAKEFEQLEKTEGELYYLTDTNQLANHKSVYTAVVDGGYFEDYSERTKFDGADGGEF